VRGQVGMKARLILRRCSLGDETRVKPFHKPPFPAIKICRHFALDIVCFYAFYASCYQGCLKRCKRKSLDPSSILFLRDRNAETSRNNVVEYPANRAIIREAHLGARQTCLNLFLVDPCQRGSHSSSLFLRC